ncbi:uncharacterized protein [Clytia hemisphaerica]|uniref:uncharacterized protein n=1 Tax=Clytia hemisphaerica TaxID=252671 RepID=UPI0034D7ACDF
MSIESHVVNSTASTLSVKRHIVNSTASTLSIKSHVVNSTASTLHVVNSTASTLSVKRHIVNSTASTLPIHVKSSTSSELHWQGSVHTSTSSCQVNNWKQSGVFSSSQANVTLVQTAACTSVQLLQLSCQVNTSTESLLLESSLRYLGTDRCLHVGTTASTLAVKSTHQQRACWLGSIHTSTSSCQVNNWKQSGVFSSSQANVTLVQTAACTSLESSLGYLGTDRCLHVGTTTSTLAFKSTHQQRACWLGSIHTIVADKINCSHSTTKRCLWI